MDSQANTSITEQSVDRAGSSSRRSFVKGSVAVVSGIALSTVYVKPSLTSVSFHDATFAASSAPSVSASPSP